jgi:hypothetical protein
MEYFFLQNRVQRVSDNHKAFHNLSLSRKNFKEKVHSKYQELPSKGFQCYPPKLPMVLLKMAPSVSQFQEEIVPAFLQTGQSKFLILCQAIYTAQKHISINMERTSK